MLIGKLDQPGCGFAPLSEENNDQGAVEMAEEPQAAAAVRVADTRASSAPIVGGAPAASKIASFLPEGTDVPALLRDLQENYANRGVNLVEIAGKWSLRTAGDLSFILRRESVEQRKLSKAALETLAIIAYRQPITRAQIEQIRGVNPDVLRRKAEPVLDAVASGERADAVPASPSTHDPTHPDDASLVVIAEALVKRTAREHLDARGLPLRDALLHLRLRETQVPGAEGDVTEWMADQRVANVGETPRDGGERRRRGGHERRLRESAGGRGPRPARPQP